MDQLWGIALRAQSADISRAAIQYINSYYINGQSSAALAQRSAFVHSSSNCSKRSKHGVILSAGKTGLEKEQEFITKCMESLLLASANLDKDAHTSLTSIERGLLMLKTHLEAFRRRYGQQKAGIPSGFCRKTV